MLAIRTNELTNYLEYVVNPQYIFLFIYELSQCKWTWLSRYLVPLNKISFSGSSNNKFWFDSYLVGNNAVSGVMIYSFRYVR